MVEEGLELGQLRLGLLLAPKQEGERGRIEHCFLNVEGRVLAQCEGHGVARPCVE